MDLRNGSRQNRKGKETFSCARDDSFATFLFSHGLTRMMAMCNLFIRWGMKFEWRMITLIFNMFRSDAIPFVRSTLSRNVQTSTILMLNKGITFHYRWFLIFPLPILWKQMKSCLTVILCNLLLMCSLHFVCLSVGVAVCVHVHTYRVQMCIYFYLFGVFFALLLSKAETFSDSERIFACRYPTRSRHFRIAAYTIYM